MSVDTIVSGGFALAVGGCELIATRVRPVPTRDTIARGMPGAPETRR